MYIHVQAPSPERYAEQSTEKGASAQRCPLNRSLRATKGAEPRSHLALQGGANNSFQPLKKLLEGGDGRSEVVVGGEKIQQAYHF
jgi:hypothetical protein